MWYTHPMKNVNENLDLRIEDVESTDPDYLAWRDAKVKKTLAAMKADPSRGIPAAKVGEMLKR